MERVYTFTDETGKRYAVPKSETQEFFKHVPQAQLAGDFRDTKGNAYAVPGNDAEMGEFVAKVPDAKSSYRYRSKAGKDYVVPYDEMGDFLKTFRSDDAFKEERDEIDKRVEELASPKQSVVWAAAKGAVVGAGLGLKDAGRGISRAFTDQIPSMIYKPLAVLMGKDGTAVGRVFSDISRDIDSRAEARKWDDPEIEGWASIGPGAFESVAANLTPAIATHGASAVVMPALYGLSRAFDVHEAAVESGRTTEQALVLAAGAGALEGGMEYVSMLWGGGKQAKEIGKALGGRQLASNARKVLRALVGEVLSEAGTEGIQEGVGNQYDQLAAGDDIDYRQSAVAAGMGAGTGAMAAIIQGGPMVAAKIDAARSGAPVQSYSPGTSPHELAAWTLKNPEKALALAGKESPSRKDFEAAGLPRVPASERSRIAADLKELTTAETEQKTKSKGVKAGTEAAPDVMPGPSLVTDDGKVFAPGETVPNGNYTINGQQIMLSEDTPAVDVLTRLEQSPPVEPEAKVAEKEPAQPETTPPVPAPEPEKKADETPAPEPDTAGEPKAPELMTPEEWDDARPKITNNDWGLKTGRRNALKDAYQEKKPVNAMLAESVAAGEKDTRPLAVPEGYIREGDRYVFKPVPAVPAAAPDTEIDADQPTESLADAILADPEKTDLSQASDDEINAAITEIQEVAAGIADDDPQLDAISAAVDALDEESARRQEAVKPPASPAKATVAESVTETPPAADTAVAAEPATEDVAPPPVVAEEATPVAREPSAEPPPAKNKGLKVDKEATAPKIGRKGAKKKPVLTRADVELATKLDRAAAMRREAEATRKPAKAVEAAPPVETPAEAETAAPAPEALAPAPVETEPTAERILDKDNIIVASGIKPGDRVEWNDPVSGKRYTGTYNGRSSINPQGEDSVEVRIDAEAGRNWNVEADPNRLRPLAEAASPAEQEAAPPTESASEAPPEQVKPKRKGRKAEAEPVAGQEQGSTLERTKALYAEFEPNRDMAAMSQKIADLIDAKDANGLRSWVMHGKGFNDTTKKVVFRMLGKPIPHNMEGMGKAIDEWAGVSAEDRAASEQKAEEKRQAGIASREAEIHQKKESAWKASIAGDGTDRAVSYLSDMEPLRRGAAITALNKSFRFDDGVRNRREHVEKIIDAGGEVSTRVEPAVKPMTRTQFNRASNEEQRAHEKRMREGGEKTVYLVGNYDIGKHAYDYAQHLLAQRKSVTPAPTATEEAPSVPQPEAAKPAHPAPEVSYPTGTENIEQKRTRLKETRNEASKIMLQIDEKIKEADRFAQQNNILITVGRHRGQLKKALPKSKVEPYNKLKEEIRKLNVIVAGMRENVEYPLRKEIEKASLIATVNDASMPKLSRLAARVDLYTIDGSAVPKDIEAAIMVEAKAMVKQAYPDATEAEADEMARYVRSNASMLARDSKPITPEWIRDEGSRSMTMDISGMRRGEARKYAQQKGVLNYNLSPEAFANGESLKQFDDLLSGKVSRESVDAAKKVIDAEAKAMKAKADEAAKQDAEAAAEEENRVQEERQAMADFLSGDLEGPVSYLREKLREIGNGREPTGMIEPKPVEKKVARVNDALRAIESHASEDPTRLILTGVHVGSYKQRKVAVATDGRRLIMLPYEGEQKVDTTVQRLPPKQAKEMGKEYEVMDGTYPNFIQVIPPISDLKGVIPITPDAVNRLRGAVKASQVLPKGTSLSTIVSAKINGTKQIASIKSEFLLEAIDALTAAGYAPTKIMMKDTHAPLMIATENKHAFAVIMPLKIETEFPSPTSGFLHFYMNGAPVVPESPPPMTKGVGAAAARKGQSFVGQQDADYMAAVEAGDTATAQRMVDEAARAAGGARGASDWQLAETGNPITLNGWRGDGTYGGLTPEQATKFGREFLLGDGAYIAPTKNTAAAFGETRRVSMTLTNPYVITGANGASLRSLDLDAIKAQGHDGIVIVSGQWGVGRGQEGLKQAVRFDGVLSEGHAEPLSGAVVAGQRVRINAIADSEYNRGFRADALAAQGKEGVVVRLGLGNHPVVRIGKKNIQFNLSEVAPSRKVVTGTTDAGSTTAEAGRVGSSPTGASKSADAITRDDVGNVVPLSKRFNSESSDIRGDVAPKKLPSGVGAAAARGEGEFINARRPVGETEAVNATGLRESVAEIERRALQMPPEVKDAARTFPEVAEKAWKRMQESSTAAQDLIDELMQAPRPLTDVEVAMLTIEKVRRWNERNNAASETVKLANSGDEHAKAAAKLRYEVAARRMEELFDVAARGRGKSITETARGLSALRMMMDDEFELVSMEQTVRDKQGGKTLSNEQRAELAKIKAEYDAARTKLDAEVNRLTEDLDAKTKELAESKANADFLKMVNEVTATQDKSPLRKKMLSLADRLEAEALASMKARGSRMSAGVDPTVLLDMGKLGAAYIIRGSVTLADWTAKMRSVFADASDDDLNRARDEAERIARGTRDEAMSEQAKQRKTERGKAQGGQSELSKEVKALMREQVESGVTTLDEAIVNVHTELVDAYEGITTEQVRDAFSDYGKARPLNADDVSRILADLRRQAQLVASIERVQQQLAPLKSGPQRDKPSQIARQLTRELNRLMREAGIKTTDEETQIASALQAKKTRMENAIADLEKALAEQKRMEPGSLLPIENDDEANQIEARLKSLREQYDEAFPREPLTIEQRLERATRAAERSLEQANQRLRDARSGKFPSKEKSALPFNERLAAVRAERDAANAEVERLRELAEPGKKAVEAKKRRLQTAIKEVERRIREKDFAVREQKRVDISGDPEAMAAQVEYERVKNEYAAMKERARRDARTPLEVAKETGLEVMDAQRNILASFDISAVGRQGWYAFMSHPVIGLKATARMLQAFKRGNSAVIAEKLRSRKNYPLYQQAKLGIVDDDGTGNFSHVEDRFRLDLVGKLPGINLSNRAYATFLNAIRADAFDSMLANSRDPSDVSREKIEALARGINELTGRGELGRLNPETLARFMWAPRFLKSAFDILTVRPLRTGTNETRIIFSKEYMRAAATLTVIYMLAGLFRDDDDDEPIEWDPRSSDFGAIPVGNHKINPLGFARTLLTFMARNVAGVTVAGGQKRKLRKFATAFDDGAKEPQFGSGMEQVWMRFAQSKAHPTIGTAFSVFSGKEFGGKDITTGGVVKDMTIPLALRESYQTMMIDDPDAAVALSLMLMLGIDVKPDYASPEYLRFEAKDEAAFKDKVGKLLVAATDPSASDAEVASGVKASRSMSPEDRRAALRDAYTGKVGSDSYRHRMAILRWMDTKRDE